MEWGGLKFKYPECIQSAVKYTLLIFYFIYFFNGSLEKSKYNLIEIPGLFFNRDNS